MKYQYKTDGSSLIRFDDYESEIFAECPTAKTALRLLQHGWALNEQRKYTAFARKLSEAENLPGFRYCGRWSDIDEAAR